MTLTETGDGFSVWAVFGEVNIPIVKGLEANAAVRYDHYSDFGSTTNPKFSVKFNPVKEVLFRGSYGEGFRAPYFGELYLSTPPSFVGNPNLKPEESKSFDAGIEQKFFGGRLTLDLDTVAALWSKTYNTEGKPDWSQRYAGWKEIQQYILETTERHGLRPFIRFGHAVTSMRTSTSVPASTCGSSSSRLWRAFLRRVSRSPCSHAGIPQHWRPVTHATSTWFFSSTSRTSRPSARSPTSVGCAAACCTSRR